MAHKIEAAPPLILCGGFLLLILCGTALLKLPFITVMDLSWKQALFVATSAVTVTGLTVVDIGSTFTVWGQALIALLVQLGGLGIMTFAVVTLLALGRKLGFMQRTVTREAFNQTDASTILQTAKSVLLFTLFVEGIGFVCLSWYWVPQLGWSTGLFHSFFYTICAFNNAGFALSASSLGQYVVDPVINTVIMGLFIVGGLGFTVWMELLRKKKWSRLSVYTRTMITGTCIINLIAFMAVILIEWSNPNTLQPLSAAGKWIASWFQAVSPRSVGFHTLPTEELRTATTSLILLLMFIGGGSVSTASGIKVVTFIVLIRATYSYLKRDKAVTLFQREVDTETIHKALSLTVVTAAVAWVSIFILSITEQAGFLDIVFETVSALGTVGLTRGLTPHLSELGEYLIMGLMFIGRVGPLTFAYLLASPRSRRLRYPEIRLSIG